MNETQIVQRFGGECCDEVTATGFRMIRSDVADITVDVQTTVFELILRNELSDVREEVYEYIADTITAVKEGDVPVEQLGVRNGIGQELEEYGSANRRPSPEYRASKFVNEHVDGENLGEGSKPMLWPITKVVSDDIPHTYTAETAENGDRVESIVAEDPSNVVDLVEFDYDTIAQKTVIDCVKPIIDNIDEYDWDAITLGHQAGSLDQFM